MTRPTSINIALGLAAAGLAGALLLALGRPSHTQVWTDGASIRTLGDAAPIREVLWRPAEPLKGASFGAADEYEPRYSADGTVVVFVRNRPGQNADLFTARWTPKGWGDPTPIDGINTKDNELGPELSRDGELLYFYSDRPGGLGGYDIWVSHLTNGSWGTPTNLGPSINSRWNDYGPALSPDGERLYFSSNRPRPGEAAPNDDAWPATIREHRTRHDYDLYVAELTQGPSESKPVVALNTPADEGAPAISPAGDFLYFASDRTGGLGGFDLYRARLTRSGFGPIENLGPNINSPGNDLDPALTSDGFRLTFSSDRATPDNDQAQLATPSSRGAGSPGAVDDPAKYSLWTSTSREVYRETQEGEIRALAWLNAMWPWLLLLALSLALLYLFYRLLMDPRWRRRFGRLGLLAQCVLISLLVHAGIASLLTIWKVGSGIIDLVHKGGGTRVVLTSGAPSGSVAGQVRDSLTDAPTSAPTLEPLAVSVMASLPESSATALPLPDMSLPAINAPTTAIAEPKERESLTNAPLPNPERRTEATSSVPTAPAPMPLAAESQSPAPAIAAANAPAPSIPSLSSGPVRMEVPSMPQGPASAPVSVTITSPQHQEASRLAGAPAHPATSSAPPSTAIPRAVAPATAAAEPEAPRPALAFSSDSSPTTPSVSAYAIEVAPAARAGSSASGRPIAIDTPTPQSREGSHSAAVAGSPGSTAATGNPALPTAAAPQPTAELASGSPSGTAIPQALPSASIPSNAARVDLPMGAMASSADQQRALPGSAVSQVGTPTAVRGETSAPQLAAGSSVPSSRATGVDTALPRPAAASAAPAPEAQLPTPGGGSALAAPTPLAGAVGSHDQPTLVQIDPGQRQGTHGPSAGAASAIHPEVATPSPDRHASTGPTPGVRPLAAAPSPNGQDSQIPVGIPTPLETFAQRAPESRSALVEKMGGSNQTERAVGLALDWFLRHQSKDGHWSAQGFDDGCGQCHGEAEVKADAAMTGMVLLCYLGAGHTHQQDGPYRDAVNSGLQWLIKRQAPDGDLRRGETMYGQTVSAVALCEAFAMTRDASLAEPARKAVEFVLVRAGQPASDKDTSVIGWLVFTVESARRAGFAVPQATFNAARQWLDSVAAPNVPGAYAYTKAGRASAAMTAEAMFVQQLLGHTRGERLMQQSARYILATPPKWQEGAPTFYWYYATLALFQHQGDEWKQWNDRLVAELLAHQQQKGPASGSWDTTDEWSRLGGRVYQTAACTLSLEVYYRYREKEGP